MVPSARARPATRLSELNIPGHAAELAQVAADVHKFVPYCSGAESRTSPPADKGVAAAYVTAFAKLGIPHDPACRLHQTVLHAMARRSSPIAYAEGALANELPTPIRISVPAKNCGQLSMAQAPVDDMDFAGTLSCTHD